MDKKEFGPLSSNTLVFILRNTSLLIFGCFRYFYLPPFLLLPLFLSLWSSLIPCATQIAVPNWLLEMYDLLIDHFTFSIHFHWFWYNNYSNDRWSYPSRPVGSQCLLSGRHKPRWLLGDSSQGLGGSIGKLGAMAWRSMAAGATVRAPHS